MKGPTKAFITTVYITGGVAITAILAGYTGVIDFNINKNGIRWRFEPSQPKPPALIDKEKN